MKTKTFISILNKLYKKRKNDNIFSSNKSGIMMPLSEIVDRYTICRLKSERGNVDVSDELKLYYNELKNYDKDIWDYVERLYDINGEIWNLEALIRQGRENELGLEEVGRRAIEIRNFNNRRVSVKNEIAENYGGFKDIKVNHGSDNG